MRLSIIYRFICTLSSLSIVVWVYLIKCGCSLSDVIKKLGIAYDWINFWILSSNLISYIVYFILMLVIAQITIMMFKYLDKTEIKNENIQDIRSAGEEISLTYFGLFFYALSVPSLSTLLYTYLILSLGLAMTTRFAFNPLYLFLGYRFYHIRSDKKTFMLVTKAKICDGDNIEFPILRRLNSFTLVELVSDQKKQNVK